MATGTAYKLHTNRQVRKQPDKHPIIQSKKITACADTLLQDAVETDAAIKDGTATIYATPNELFASWERGE